MPRAQVNGAEIYYELKGRGFPLVMIMGLGANIDWWPSKLLDKLAGHYQVLVFDNRGAGRSDVTEESYSIEMFARDTVELMDWTGMERAHVFGISMGGMIAQELALSYPERVERLVLGCTNCGPGHSVSAPPEVLGLLVQAPPQHRHLFQVAVSAPPEVLSLLVQAPPPPEDILKILFPEEFINNNRVEIEEFTRRYLAAPISTGAYVRQVGAILGFDSFDRMARIAVPTLVVTGDRDILIPPENSEILVQRIPGARLVFLGGCGHGFMAQVPDRVFEVLREFLGGA